MLKEYQAKDARYLPSIMTRDLMQPEIFSICAIGAYESLDNLF
jgi:hypothetical protein